jgi:hypothetical protein
MAKRMSKADKALEREYDSTYSRLGHGVQVNIMDLGKMRDEALAAVKGGATMEDAVKAAIAKYRQN